MRIFTHTTYNFLRWRWHALALSGLVVLAGAALMVTRGGPALGVDFAGGTSIVVKFDRPTSEEAVRRAIGRIPGEKVVQQYGEAGANEILIRLPMIGVEERGASLEEGSRQVVQALQQGGVGSFDVISTEIVGPVIGRDLQRKGIYATIASIVGIGLYIAVRFRPAFAVGAMAATLHDILVTLAFLTFFGYELTLNVIAAILTIAGYSVNDTIVIFDRVRENYRQLRRADLSTIVNKSVNETLGRTVITAGTTLLSVVALYLFGGEVLEPFAFAMIVGIVTGTYSTVFIASSIAIMLSKRAPAERAPARPEAAAAPSAESARPAQRSRRRDRRARA